MTYTVETFLPANFPVGMVVLPDGGMLYNEKTTGNVRLIRADGTRQLTPVIHLPITALQERGMLGITIDPDFEDNRLVYVVHTREGTARDFPANTLVRFRLNDEGQGEDLETLFSVPIETGSLLHNGGHVHFDAQGALYLTLGDYGNPAYAQDSEAPQGAIHRFILTDDGIQAHPDNHYGNSVYAIGFRNPFDFAFDPVSGRLFVTEVGPDCDDEINIVIPPFNYGWREGYECVGMGHVADVPLYSPPLMSFTPVITPTGIIFYDHPAVPAWHNDLFFCDWNYGDLWRVVLDETRGVVVDAYTLDLGTATCRISLVVGADGALYFGTVGAGGGAIVRLVPHQ